MKQPTIDKLTSNESRIAEFERAYTLDADDESRARILSWMRSWRHGTGYKHSDLQATYIGFCLALSTHISIQEAWEAAGGNPGIPATKEELITALKLLDEVCDEADDTPVVRKPKVAKVKKAPKVDAGERMRKIASAPKKAQQTTQEIGKEIRQYRQAMKMNQTDFGEYIGLAQTEVSALERGLITKRSDGGESAIEKSKRFLESVRKLYANKDAPLTIMAIGTRENADIVDKLITVVPTQKDLGNVTMHMVKPRDAHERNLQLTGSMQFDKSCLTLEQLADTSFDLIPDTKAARLLQSNFRVQYDAAAFDQLNDKEREQALVISSEAISRMTVDDKDAIIWSDFKTFVDAQRGKQLPRSSDISVGPIKLYVRAGMCFYFDGERRNAIEISRIDIPEHLQGRGLGKYFFKEVTRFAASRGINYIVVAQVHNENFREQLEAWGFSRYQAPANMEDHIYVKVLF
jgi:DNA-binding transcriptional regulator YiaG/GNAT superfamily N-acetyltransferase